LSISDYPISTTSRILGIDYSLVFLKGERTLLSAVGIITLLLPPTLKASERTTLKASERTTPDPTGEDEI
jgi:hypothetical protein